MVSGSRRVHELFTACSAAGPVSCNIHQSDMSGCQNFSGTWPCTTDPGRGCKWEADKRRPVRPQNGIATHRARRCCRTSCLSDAFLAATCLHARSRATSCATGKAWSACTATIHQKALLNNSHDIKPMSSVRHGSATHFEHIDIHRRRQV